MSKCPKCGNAAENDDLGTWPFCCRSCLNKHSAKFVRAQANELAELIRLAADFENAVKIRRPKKVRNWQATEPEPRHRPEWPKTIADGLRKLGL